MLLNDLQLETTDYALTKRIKLIIERILAKSRQHNSTLKGLCGVVISSSPTKKNNSFVDMQSKERQKSWHFNLKDQQQE